MDSDALLKAFEECAATVTPEQYWNDMAEANPGKPRLEELLRAQAAKQQDKPDC